MKKRLSNVLAVLLIVALMFSIVACGDKKDDAKNNENNEKVASSDNKDKPDTWIADRHIVGRAFIDDLGVSLPEDQLNNEVAKELKKRTGISLEWQYTSGTSDLEVMTTALAAGDLPDIICYYLNDSSRPEFPVLLKAAREEMFTDLAPIMKDTKVLKKYFEDGFLPNDSKNNIMFRPEFDGACYFVHMNIPRSEGSNDYPYRGGMYIQKAIADQIGIDPKTVETQDDFYEMLKKIKEGGFKDINGNPVYPLGPRYWGGSLASTDQYVVANYKFGLSADFNVDENGKVKHEAETDYIFKQIDFFKKLLAEDLIHPEYFTIDSTRAEELSRNNSSAVIADIHNYIDLFKTNEYLPVGPLKNYKGEVVNLKKSKAGYAGWAIPSTTKNPEEVVKFCDYLATKEGKLLWMYGIEGKHYKMVDGKPIVEQSMLDLMEEDHKAAVDTGIFMDGAGSYWLTFIGSTDVDNVEDFGEMSYGENTDPHQYDFAKKLYEYKDIPIKYIDGFGAFAYLQDNPELEPQLKPLLEQQNYDDIRVKAIFAKSDEESRKIIENYREQLKKAGIEEFEEFLEKKYKEDPESINFY